LEKVKKLRAKGKKLQEEKEVVEKITAFNGYIKRCSFSRRLRGYQAKVLGYQTE